MLDLLDINKKSRKKTLKNIGLGLMGTSAAAALILARIKSLKAFKAIKLTHEGALGSTKAVDSYIARHLAEKGKTLPKYRWSSLSDIERTGKLGIGAIKSDAGVRGVPIPVYANGQDVLDGIDILAKRHGKAGLLDKIIRRVKKNALAGGHYNMDDGYVSMGVGSTSGHINPKIMLHELGHAQDAINGTLLSEDRHVYKHLFKDWLRDIRNPDASSLLKQEIRAWDNAGIEAGDAVREAALDTYRAHVRRTRLAPVVGLPFEAGSIMYLMNKGDRRRNEHTS